MAGTGKRRSFYADLDHLRTCFNTLDPGNTGFIGYGELTKLVQSMPDTEESVVPELMEKLDRDKDGKVSFDDFVWLFKREREAKKKKQKLSVPKLPDQSSAEQSRDQSINMLSPSNSHYKTALENISESPASPLSPNDCILETSAGSVLLRRNRRRATMPSRLQRHGITDLSLLSPIHPERSPSSKGSPSTDLTDLASQMKYLTDYGDTVDSPQLKRNSKVLSWIESEDLLFEDTGTGLERGEDLPSPPTSPTCKSAELELSHVETILEEACNTKEIDNEAIMKICTHVKADPQEQEELLALLKHIDKGKRGHVSITEFAHGLQAIRNSAKVGTSTPSQHNPFRRYHSEIIPPRLSEAFGTPPSQGVKPPLSSTPSMPKLFPDESMFGSMDPNESGYIKVEDVVAYWQNMGVETSHDQNLEKIIVEALSVDPTGRVSMTDLTASLEGSILTEGKSPNILRQVALKSFKKEISTLKTHVHHISMERDKLKSSLNRTIEEKQQVIKEGDEHVDSITKKSEKRIKEQKSKHMEQIRELEKLKREESLQLQEQASNIIKDLEEKMKDLKGEEEKLRQDLKYAVEDSTSLTRQLNTARKELSKKDKTIEMLQKDLGSRSEHDLIVDESQMSRMTELESQLTEKNALIAELQDKLREIQDNCDELKADNEKMKQKHTAHKRTMQKSKSLTNTPSNLSSASKKRHSSSDGRSRYLNRPLSGSHFHRRSKTINSHVSTSMDLDLAVQKENHPILMEEDGEEGQDEVDTTPQPIYAESEEMDTEDDDDEFDALDKKSTGSSDTTETEEDSFKKSTASLMEEFHQEKMATLDRKHRRGKLMEELKRHKDIIKKLKREIFRLEEFSESQQDQLLELEEKTARLTVELTEAHYLIESERKSHEVEVNILSRKAENAENATMRLDLSLQQVMRERAKLEEDHENRVTLMEKNAQAELSKMKTKLLQATDSLYDQSALHSAEMLQLKELLEKERENSAQSSDSVVDLEEKHADEMEAIRYKLKVTVEELHKQLNAREKYVHDLKEKLEARKNEQKSLSSKLGILYEREADYKDQITVLKVSEDKYKTDIVTLKKEMSQLRSAHQRKILTLRAKFNKDVDLEMDTLQGRLNETVATCEGKIDDASKQLIVLVSSLRDNDLRHANAVKSLLFDLHQSQREINTLKDEIDKLHSELEISHNELDRLNKSKDLLAKLKMAKDEEVDELKFKLEQANLRGDIALAISADTVSSRNVKVDADSGQVIAEQEDTQTRNSLLLEKEEIIRSLRSELESLKHTERHARILGEEANRKLLEKEREIWQTRDESETLQRQVDSFESKIKQLQNECASYAEEVDSLTQSLQLAKKELRISQEQLEFQQGQTLDQLKDKHLIELNLVKDAVSTNRQDARKLYSYILEANGRRQFISTCHGQDLSHPQLILESMKEIDKLKDKLSEHQRICTELEATLEEKMEEHEILEAQFTAEHEEEVRALRQQKQHLVQRLEESKDHYESILDSQEEQNTALQKELESSKLDMEKQLKQKTEEVFHVYQRIADLGEEKKVLTDIIKQLCMEAGRQIDVV